MCASHLKTSNNPTFNSKGIIVHLICPHTRLDLQINLEERLQQCERDTTAYWYRFIRVYTKLDAPGIPLETVMMLIYVTSLWTAGEQATAAFKWLTEISQFRQHINSYSMFRCATILFGNSSWWNMCNHIILYIQPCNSVACGGKQRQLLLTWNHLYREACDESMPYNLLDLMQSTLRRMIDGY